MWKGENAQWVLIDYLNVVGLCVPAKDQRFYNLRHCGLMPDAGISPIRNYQTIIEIIEWQKRKILTRKRRQVVRLSCTVQCILVYTIITYRHHYAWWWTNPRTVPWSVLKTRASGGDVSR